MYKVFLFTGIVTLDYAIIVNSQSSASVSPNPFLYMSGAVSVRLVLFLLAAILFDSEAKKDYLTANLIPVPNRGVGFFIILVGFTPIYSRASANRYTVYATLTFLTGSVGAGIVIFREMINV